MVAKNIEEDINDLENLLSRDSKNTILLTTLSELYIKNGNLTKAKNYLDKALSIDPKDVTALIKIGEYYCSTNNLNEAKKYFEKAYNIKHNRVTCISYSNYFIRAAKKDLDNKETKKAKSSLEKALQYADEAIKSYSINRQHNDWLSKNRERIINLINSIK